MIGGEESSENDQPETDLLNVELPLEQGKNKLLTTEPLQTLRKTKLDFSDLDTGWAWVVLFASFWIFCILGGAMYTVGIIHSTLLERYHASTFLTSLAGALHTALISVAGPLSSAVSDRFSCRAAIVLSGFLYVAGYIGTAFAPSIEIAIFTCGVISGTAGGLAYTASTVVISYCFRRRRNLAIGISNSGVGAGLFIFAPLMQFLRDYYGPVGFFIIMAGIFCNLIPLGLLCFPSHLELFIKDKRYLARCNRRNLAGTFCRVPYKCNFLIRYWNVLTNKGILCYCIANFCFCTAIYVMYLHFPNFISFKGFSSNEAATFISISGACNIAGRLVCGMLANSACVGDIAIYAGTMGIVSLISFIYPLLAHHYIGHIVYFALLGFFLGPSAVIATSVSLKFVAVDSVATALGLQFLSGGIGAIIGPVFTGFLIDMGLSYDMVIYISACLAAVATVVGVKTAFFEHRPAHEETYTFCTRDE